MTNQYDSIFAVLHRACGRFSGDERETMDTAALLFAALQFLNVSSIALLLKWVDEWTKDIQLVVGGAVIWILVVLNRRRVHRGAWKYIIGEFDRGKPRGGATLVAALYSIFSFVAFFLAAW